MKVLKGVAAGVIAPVGLAAALFGGSTAAGAPAPTKLQQPAWAYGIEPAAPAKADDGALLRLPGTEGAYTITQINGRDKNRVPPGPVDWFPSMHPPMPRVVASGDASKKNFLACALCHYPNGKGRPENAPLAGLSKAYIVRQLRDFRDGLRRSAEPAKTNTQTMIDIAKQLDDAQIDQTAEYYSSMRWTPWIRVTPSATAPKTRNAVGMYIALTGEQAGQEPLAGRIVEVPVNGELTEMRDPRSGFQAYVPIGSIARGRVLVTTGGGNSTPCASCHGKALNGAGDVPGIAGRSPSYIARQLNDIKQGARHGADAALMQPVVARFTTRDITAIAAYLASRPVPAGPRPKG